MRNDLMNRYCDFAQNLPQTPGVPGTDAMILMRMTKKAATQDLAGRWLDYDEAYKLWQEAIEFFQAPTPTDFMAFQTYMRKLFKHRDLLLVDRCEVLRSEWLVEDEAGRKAKKTLFSFKCSMENVTLLSDFATRLSEESEPQTPEVANATN